MRFFILGILLLFSFSSASQEKTMIRKVVIDAGHGGKDPGTVGRKTQEKDITLAIALKLGAQIEKNFKDVKVIYTRESDVFVELFQRAEIANRNKADLFISIHCNANRSHSFQGSETYVMGLHKTQQNLEISKLENASILMEPDYLINYDGFDPNSDESYITFTLFQNAFLNQSTELASVVQNELKGHAGMDDRGVRQAGFLVLYKTTMPSILIETGFLSNPVEESFLLSKGGQEHIADAICRALIAYKLKVEKSAQPIVEKAKEKPVNKNDVGSVPVKESKNEVKPVPEKPAPHPMVEKTPEKIDGSISFSVQVAVYQKQIDIRKSKFAGLTNVTFYKHNNQYKYIVGSEKEFSGALVLMEELRKKGFKDAFVVAFQGNERIPVNEAMEILNKQKTK